ncbi:unnamed protein product [Leuciscus chuanchicus]
MVNIGETATFSCEYSQNHINDPKIIFKEGKDSIETIYSTSKKTERFSVSDDRHKNLFNVRITAVTPDDGGVYLCGVWINRHSYSYSIINTVHLHIGMAPVVRREGESAEIFCPYDSIYKSKSKSLCKGKCSTRDRNTLNETVREEKETKTDRLTLNDDVTASVFTGTITGLTAEDAGKYWCAVTLERDVNYLYTHLIVIMNEELNLTKYEGDDVSIQCKHHDEHQKCFCKAHEPSMCVKDGVSLETIRDDRFSFSDEASTGVFTVNITDLREEDSGIYWCGSHIITKVTLTVKQERSGSRSPGLWSARRRSQTWGSQMDLSVDAETGSALSQSPSDRLSASHQGSEARVAVSSAPMEAPTLQLSSFEELDVVSVDAESEDSPPQSHAFEELIEVVTRAVERLSIEWPEDQQDVRSKSKLDERFLPSRAQPQRRCLPFFPRSPHRATAPSLKAPMLPTKPVRVTSSLVNKAYSAAGQAAACLHTMSLMQAYQAELLGDLNEGGGIGPDVVCELRRATYLSLRATKETAKSIGRSMAALVATERHVAQPQQHQR